MKVYLSSTYEDLKHHRAVVGNALRKAQYDVVMMEEYVARDQRVEFACAGDVVGCDVYVGVFAWRYGYVPEDDNPKGLSVTEMEYRAAGKDIERLTFLLKDGARWPKAKRDADPRQIERFRGDLAKRCSAYFSTKDGLSTEVLAALRVHESSRLVQQLKAVDVIREAQQLGPSYMVDIERRIDVLAEAPFIEIRLGPVPWWNTRLYLVAALAEDFETPLGLVLTDQDGRFVIMASPAEIRHRLALRWPEVEQAYAAFRAEAGDLSEIQGHLWRYPTVVAEVMGNEERHVKHDLRPRDLERELGIYRTAEIVDVVDKGQLDLQREIIGRTTPYVALVRDGRLEDLVDRNLLNQRVAQAALANAG